MTEGLHNRRDLIAAAIAAALGSVEMARAQVAKAIDLRTIKQQLKLTPLQFVSTADGLGALGPWGELRVRETAAGLVPTFLQSSDRAGIIDLSGRRGSITLGGGAIALTSAGVQFGSGTSPRAWDKLTVRQLIDVIARNERLRRSLFELRAAFVTTYAGVVANRKGKRNDTVAAVVHKAARAMGGAASPGKSNCTTQTITDSVVSEVTEQVEVWKTAEQQFDECVAAEVKAGIFGGELAALALCVAKGFVDMVVGVMTVVRSIAEEVTRVVVSCVPAAGTALRDVFRGLDVDLPGPSLAVPSPPKPGLVFSSKDIDEARRFLRSFLAGVNGYLDCLLDAKWSIAAAELPLAIGAAGVDIPYGIRLCLPAGCARAMTLEQARRTLADSGGTMAGLLASLVPGLGSLAAALGIPEAALLSTAMLGTLGPGAWAAAVVMLVMLLLLAYYAIAIFAQMQLLPDAAFADGEVCIEHPTLLIALANILLAPNSVSLLFLIPPIVTG
ncbi:MAG: hypothetical protein U1F11_01500 [Steroidobacteraceae bacterium]